MTQPLKCRFDGWTKSEALVQGLFSISLPPPQWLFKHRVVLKVSRYFSAGWEPQEVALKGSMRMAKTKC